MPNPLNQDFFLGHYDPLHDWFLFLLSIKEEIKEAQLFHLTVQWPEPGETGN